MKTPVKQSYRAWACKLPDGTFQCTKQAPSVIGVAETAEQAARYMHPDATVVPVLVTVEQVPWEQA